ncbi:MAG: CapA family protein [Bacilli bacterium]|nr:CapA family protein [Bacilli bacterium]
MSKKKIKLRKKTRLIVVFLLIGILGVLSYDYFIFGNKNNEQGVVKDAFRKIAKRAEDYEAKVFMVGDSLIHSSVYQDARLDDGNYDFKPMLSAIKPISSKYDLAYFNQETILVEKKWDFLIIQDLIHLRKLEMLSWMLDLILFL